jgi:hypothetical protein
MGRCFLVGLVLLLAGCESTPVEQMSYSETKELALRLHKRCADEGAPQGSKEFDACMRQELSREASLRRERHNTTVCMPIGYAVVCQ